MISSDTNKPAVRDITITVYDVMHFKIDRALMYSVARLLAATRDSGDLMDIRSETIKMIHDS